MRTEADNSLKLGKQNCTLARVPLQNRDCTDHRHNNSNHDKGHVQALLHTIQATSKELKVGSSREHDRDSCDDKNERNRQQT